MSKMISIPTTNIGLISKLSQYEGATTSNVSLIARLQPPDTYGVFGMTYADLGYMGFDGPGNYVFWAKIINTDGARGKLYLTNPWTENAFATNSYVGYGRQVYARWGETIRVTCVPEYGYIWTGWWDQPIGGTLVIGGLSNPLIISTGISTDIYCQYA